MAIFSSPLILRILSILHAYFAYLLLTDPSKLLTQNLPFVLGGAMRIPDPPASSLPSTPNAATCLAGLALAYVSTSDFLATLLPEFAYDEHWASQVPVRLLCLFALEAWIYVTGKEADADFALAGLSTGLSAEGSRSDGVRNSLVLSWGLVELAGLFWAFLRLRDERKERAVKELEKRRRER